MSPTTNTDPSRRMAVLSRGPCAYLFCAWMVFGFSFVARALDTNQPARLPALKPPHGELSPGFWEQHTVAVVIGGILFLSALGLLIWFLRRPKPPLITPPVVQARRDLESLRCRSEDGSLLSRVSQVLRRYFTDGSPTELTTTEVCRLINQKSEWASEVGASACDFLRRCDEQKFSPKPPPAQGGTVVQALALLDRAEAAKQAHAEALAAARSAVPDSGDGARTKTG